MISVSPNLKTIVRKQHTLRTDVTFSGIGIHTGAQVKMRFVPASEGTGIVFKRSDLPDHPIIPATVSSVCDTSRSTTIGIGKVRGALARGALGAGKDSACAICDRFDS